MPTGFNVGDVVRIARDAAIRTRLARGFGSVTEGTIVGLCSDNAVVRVVSPGSASMQAVFKFAELERS
jgi:hypothetical protein